MARGLLARGLLARLARGLAGGRHPPARRAVVVLGMHRSGTSVTTSLLHRLGLRLDDELVPAAPDNPRGFWESRRIVDLHEDLLTKLGRSWKQPFLLAPLPREWWREPAVLPIRRALAEVVRREVAREGVWGFKDPRTARLLPLWQTIFAEEGIAPIWVLVFRHPAAVIASLAARNALDPALAELLWIEHNLDPLEQIPPADLFAVDFDRLAGAPGPGPGLTALAKRLRTHGIVLDAGTARAADAMFDPAMVHHKAPETAPCSDFARAIHGHLGRLHDRPGAPAPWPDRIAAVAARDVAALTARALHDTTHNSAEAKRADAPKLAYSHR